MLYATLAIVVSIARPALAAEPRHLLPSEVSELEEVYDRLRTAARDGDVQAYTKSFDPDSLVTATTTPDGGQSELTADWLQSHAREWPDLAGWEFIEMRGSDEWARLVLRHAHPVEASQPPKWDLYVLVFRHVDDTWRLTRRAIAVTPQNGHGPATLADVRLPAPYLLPPR